MRTQPAIRLRSYELSGGTERLGKEVTIKSLGPCEKRDKPYAKSQDVLGTLTV